MAVILKAFSIFLWILLVLVVIDVVVLIWLIIKSKVEEKSIKK